MNRKESDQIVAHAKQKGFTMKTERYHVDDRYTWLAIFRCACCSTMVAFAWGDSRAKSIKAADDKAKRRGIYR